MGEDHLWCQDCEQNEEKEYDEAKEHEIEILKGECQGKPHKRDWKKKDGKIEGPEANDCKEQLDGKEDHDNNNVKQKKDKREKHDKGL